MSCVSPGNCVAVGAADDSQQAFAVTELKGAWGAAHIIAVPAGSLSAQLNSVSCASLADCGAGGTYSDADTAFHAFVVTETKGAWGAAQDVPGIVPVLSGPAAQVLSVSCPTAGNCAAGGIEGDGAAFVVDDVAGAWGKARPLKSEGSGGGIQSVSCSSPGNCSAVGFTGLVVSEADHHWTAAQLLPGEPFLSSVSCAAPGDCAAGGGTSANKQLVIDETNPVVGIYSDFTSTADVRKAISQGWSLLANIAGLGAPAGCAAPWTKPAPARAKLDSDYQVEQVLSKQATDHPAWISYWTPEIPPVGTDLFDAGKAAGQAAAADVASVARTVLNPVTPTYVALDFETSAPAGQPSAKSCGHDADPGKRPKKGDKQCWDWASKEKANCFGVGPADWKQFALGWAAGVESAKSLQLAPAIYVNKTEYSTDKAGTFGLPVIVAISPILTSKPIQGQGPNIIGYAGFYGTCQGAAADVAKIRSWGRLDNSVQFTASKIFPPSATGTC